MTGLLKLGPRKSRFQQVAGQKDIQDTQPIFPSRLLIQCLAILGLHYPIYFGIRAIYAVFLSEGFSKTNLQARLASSLALVSAFLLLLVRLQRLGTSERQSHLKLEAIVRNNLCNTVSGINRFGFGIIKLYNKCCLQRILCSLRR